MHCTAFQNLVHFDFVKIRYAGAFWVPAAAKLTKSTYSQMEEGGQRSNWKLEYYWHFLTFAFS